MIMTVTDPPARRHLIKAAPPPKAVTDEDRRVRALYDGVKGSAVNPVLREGNSDRRAAQGGDEKRREYSPPTNPPPRSPPVE